ncbi:uncharacterized protein AMSG_01165 [Thecamonas trahens ATCC 50062]|uniref:Uncharacterized protein n=1 Tax=Thecamonas trahens ATCC 50062 TaxID=461836 RepID=A0A0L0DMB4_THETB|nr:hypothetical protein AMSG_01165 [Thecamonas trahens ATCC 50062]KNC53452.1 hypothetical protein AMSG_01165 [Thecamonas trahens ATCC 50062]|eukprot:XP_013761776.1 hypothetical protein AMSG_01165 [Thecamonas trahens ATCC 50062]
MALLQARPERVVFAPTSHTAEKGTDRASSPAPVLTKRVLLRSLERTAALRVELARPAHPAYALRGPTSVLIPPKGTLPLTIELSVDALRGHAISDVVFVRATRVKDLALGRGEASDDDDDDPYTVAAGMPPDSPGAVQEIALVLEMSEAAEKLASALSPPRRSVKSAMMPRDVARAMARSSRRVAEARERKRAELLASKSTGVLGGNAGSAKSKAKAARARSTKRSASLRYGHSRPGGPLDDIDGVVANALKAVGLDETALASSSRRRGSDSGSGSGSARRHGRRSAPAGRLAVADMPSFAANPYNPDLFSHIDMDEYRASKAAAKAEAATPLKERERGWNTSVVHPESRSKTGLAPALRHKNKLDMSILQKRKLFRKQLFESSMRQAGVPDSDSSDSAGAAGSSEASPSGPPSVRFSNTTKTPPAARSPARYSSRSPSPARRGGNILPPLHARRMSAPPSPMRSPEVSPIKRTGGRSSPSPFPSHARRSARRSARRKSPIESEWQRTVTTEHRNHLEESGYFAKPVAARPHPASIPQLLHPDSRGHRHRSSIIVGGDRPLASPAFFVDGCYYNARGEDVSAMVMKLFRTPELSP